MSQTSALLRFPKSIVDTPVISRLVHSFDVEVNIVQASVSQDEDGRMFVIFHGERGSVKDALDYLRDLGVRVTLPVRNLVWDEDLCAHCGACVGQCPSSAFTVDGDTRRVVFDGKRCIACELCIPACSYGAIESIGEHLERTGEAS